MALTPEQRAARDGKLTASRVGVLMNGGDEALYDLWRDLTGDPSYTPTDLSGRLGGAARHHHRVPQPRLVRAQDRACADAARRGRAVRGTALGPLARWTAGTRPMATRTRRSAR